MRLSQSYMTYGIFIIHPVNISALTPLVNASVRNMRANSEEKMLPLARASVANRLLHMGFRVNQISLVLDVTPPAVTQYLKGVRGKKITETENQKQMIDALAEKGAQRINGNMEPLSTIELLHVAHQILAVTSGERMLGTRSESRKKSKSIAILKARLQLELKAAAKMSRSGESCKRRLHPTLAAHGRVRQYQTRGHCLPNSLMAGEWA